MQALERHGDEFSHPAVGVHAEDLQALATVVLAGAAGVALAAAQIRLDGAAVARTDAASVRGRFDHLDAQLVPEHARISEIRLPSGKGVQVRAADPDAMDSHQRFVRARLGRSRVDAGESSGLFEDDLTHGLFT